MRIESTGIYTSTGQPGKIITGKNDLNKSQPSNRNANKAEPAKQSFASLLSEAETSQLTKLFGKFDLKELAGNSPVTPEDDRPGQVIDILV
jgi:hypothetical protein